MTDRDHLLGVRNGAGVMPTLSVDPDPLSLADRDADRGLAAGVEQLSDGDLVAHAYSLLLQQPGLDLRQFAARLDCEQDQVRSVLDRLADLSLLQGRQSEYGSMVAVSPVVAMLRLITREQRFLRERHRFLGQSYDTFSSILAVYTGSVDDLQGGQLAEQLTDLPSVRRRLEEIAASGKEEVLSFTPVAGNPTATRAASRPLDLSALTQGVRMRTLYQDTLAFEPAALSYAQELAAAGAQIRMVPRLPMRLIIVDRQTAVIARNPRNDSEGAVFIRHDGMVLALVELFEAYWHLGRRLPKPGDEAPACSPAEMAIVALLAAGAKDDAVARQLGTSVRTVRRLIADLMVRAEVGSRFALGVHAATNDWV